VKSGRLVAKHLNLQSVHPGHATNQSVSGPGDVQFPPPGRKKKMAATRQDGRHES
jgi:hypothetical protein